MPAATTKVSTATDANPRRPGTTREPKWGGILTRKMGKMSRPGKLDRPAGYRPASRIAASASARATRVNRSVVNPPAVRQSAAAIAARARSAFPSRA